MPQVRSSPSNAPRLITRVKRRLPNKKEGCGMFETLSYYFLPELSSPATIQSMVLPECAFRLRRTSNVGSFWPFSYFDSCAWPIPRILPNSAWVSTNPRISLMRRPIACGSTRTLIFFLIIFPIVVYYSVHEYLRSVTLLASVRILSHRPQ